MADQTIAIPDLSRPWPLLPLRSAVLFPNVVVPFDIGRPKTIALAKSLAEALTTKGAHIRGRLLAEALKRRRSGGE